MSIVCYSHSIMVDDRAGASFDGSRLRALREERNWSCQDLASRTVPPLSRAYIYLLEGNPGADSNPRRPSYDVVSRLARALDVDPSAFSAATEAADAPEPGPEQFLPPALREAADRFSMEEGDVADLARIEFRGRRPHSPTGWAQVWMALVNEQTD